MTKSWFEAVSGKIISEEEAFLLWDAETAYPVYLPDVLIDADFPFQPENRRAKAKDWPEQRCIDVGKWALQLLEQGSETPQPFTELTIKRLAALGLAPSPEYLRSPRRFGSFTNFKEAIDAPAENDPDRFRGKYIGIAQRVVIGDARRLADHLGRKPRQLDYFAAARQGQIMGYTRIWKTFGGIDNLNDLIGYPNYKTCSYDWFLDYGVAFVKANGVDALVPAAFDLLAKRSKGPWVGSITYRFPVKWGEYKSNVLSEFEAHTFHEDHESSSRVTKLSHYSKLIEDGVLPEKLKLDEKKLLQVGGRFTLLAKCLPDADLETLTKIALSTKVDLLRKISSLSLAVTPAHIELRALELDVIDDIWPIENPVFNLDLKLEPNDLTDIREKRRENEARRRAAKKTNRDDEAA